VTNIVFNWIDKMKVKKSNADHWWAFMVPFSTVTSLTLITGISIYASIRSASFAQYWPFSCVDGVDGCLTSPEVTPEMVAFGVVSIIVVLFVLAQIYGQSRRQKQTEDLLEETRALVMATPPRHLMRHVLKAYRQCAKAREHIELAENVTARELVEVIQLHLNAILGVAHFWNEHTEKPGLVQYRATVMEVRSPASFVTPEGFDKLQGEIRFADTSQIRRNDGCDHFDQYLTTLSALSLQYSQEPTKVRDPDIQPLILGVVAPASEEGGSPTRMVAGAPYCLIDGIPQYVGDTKVIAEMAQRDDYLRPFASEIREYYARDKLAKCILSLPLPAPENPVGKWEAGEPPFSYVLNIFSNKVNMFDSSRDVAENFSALVAPLCDMLVELLEVAVFNGIDLDVDHDDG
jgi:hypothetical protein